MINDKQQTFTTVNTLPDDTTCDDDIYAFYLNSKIKKSEDDIKNGRVITLEELDREMEEKYESCSIKRSHTRHK